MDARSADRITYIRTSEALPELWIKEAYQGGCSLWAGGGGGFEQGAGYDGNFVVDFVRYPTWTRVSSQDMRLYPPYHICICLHAIP